MILGLGEVSVDLVGQEQPAGKVRGSRKMAGKHVETFALKLGKKCPKSGNILWGPGNGFDVSGWCWEVYGS